MPKQKINKKVLRFIFDYWNENNRRYPDRVEIAAHFGRSTSHVGKIINELALENHLTRNGRTTDDFELTPNAIRDFENSIGLFSDSDISRQFSDKNTGKDLIYADFEDDGTINKGGSARSFHPLEISLRGQVRAGKGNQPDDNFIDFDVTDTISIPHVRTRKDIFALEVVGESMVTEHILPGDIVIVEEASISDIKEGDLIVTEYLDPRFNSVKHSELPLAIQIKQNYGGPTLKYYSQILGETIKPSGQRERIHMLSVRKGKEMIENRDNVIKTRILNVIGKVVAVYRSISKK